MASFEAVNYSLRPSKTIQRQLVFEGVLKLQGSLNLDQMLFVGFGSIWFTDFVLAHRILQVRDMRSIEANDVGYARACFNKPYATVQVEKGFSSEVLPLLFRDGVLMNRPWLIWLDYDKGLSEAVASDIRLVIENAPMNSIFIVTFNSRDVVYGHASDRVERLRTILGAVVPDELQKSACKEERMQQTLADLTMDYMTSIAAEAARPGGALGAFRIVYEDTTPMVTVGVVLPARGAASTASQIVNSASWSARPPLPIKAPHLTLRETATLQAQLPQDTPLTRDEVRKLGFDLEEDQIHAFQAYYRQYPSFAQIVA